MQNQPMAALYPGTGKKAEKYSVIGRPYRVKTKLPFYDGKGVYQGVKVASAAGITTGSL